MFRLCVVLSCLVYYAASQSQVVGGSCRIHGWAGVCTRLNECEATSHVHRNDETCGSKDNNFVCCLRGISTTTARPVATTHRLSSTTTEYIPPVYDYQTNYPEVNGCAPLLPTETAAKIGRKAWDSCIDYHEQLVRPCQRSVALLGGLARANNCMHNDGVFVGSSIVSHDEASHVALLGYKLANDSMILSCSGTLLSDRFILTAAHCKFGRISRGKSYARVGSRKGIDRMDAPQEHRLQRIIRHPLYNKTSRQNDIALIMTETRVTLNQWTVPACLDVFGGKYAEAIALSSSISKADNNIVKKVSLNQFTFEQCQRLRNKRKMKIRLNTTTQSCYGTHTFLFDTTRADTGGPLVIKNPRIECMYSVVGVMSLAQRFKSKIPGVFTKVAHYVPWIESVVWP